MKKRHVRKSLKSRFVYKNLPDTYFRKHGAELLRRYAVKLVPLRQLKPSPENEEIYGPITFQTDPALQSMVDSIERLGLEEPLIVTADNYILSGHRRFVAVQHLGWAQVPVRFKKVRRDESTDYHRLLAQYNPQRVKSVAALLSEEFLKSETCLSDDDFHARHYEKGETRAEFITVEGSKLIDPIGKRQEEFLAAAVDVINQLENFWPLTLRQVHYKLLNAPPLTQVTRERNERWRYRNDEASYAKLSKLLVSARYLGHVIAEQIARQWNASRRPKPFRCACRWKADCGSGIGSSDSALAANYLD